MALTRNFGNPTTIAAGATQYWWYTYGGRDVGMSLVAPNLLEDQINVALVAFDQGVVAVESGGEGGSVLQYLVSIQNRGNAAITYNLNVWNPS